MVVTAVHFLAFMPLIEVVHVVLCFTTYVFLGLCFFQLVAIEPYMVTNKEKGEDEEEEEEGSRISELGVIRLGHAMGIETGSSAPFEGDEEGGVLSWNCHLPRC